MSFSLPDTYRSRVVVALILAVACGEPTGPTTAPVADVIVTLPSTTVTIGSTTQASVLLKDASGNALTGREVSWSSSDPNVASVTGNGTITALSKGSATITATSEGKSGVTTITVALGVDQVVVALPQPGLAVGFSVQASHTLKDSEGNLLTGRAVTWASSNAAVATVSQSGVVTGVGTGTATITATSEGESGSASIAIVVIRQQSLSAGWLHTCAISLEGDAYCWGENGRGQLGDGTTTDRVSPVRVAGGLKFSAIAAKTWTTYALTSDGRLFCWGKPNSDGDWQDVNAGGPVQERGACDTASPAALTPRQVETKRAITALAREMVGNCAIGVGNVVYCWGEVTGAGNWSVVPDAPVPGDNAFADVSGYLATKDNTATLVCALTTAGAAYCWGYIYWTLGNGPGGSRESSVPLRVAGNHVFKDIAVGQTHACGLTTAGQTYCWGNPSYTGHAASMPESCDSHGCHTPVPVSGGHIFESLTAGTQWTCGLTANGDPYCWGQQPFGRTPISFRYWSFGEAPDYQDPYANVKYRIVSPGHLHACATSTEGDVYCMNHQTYDGTDAADRARAVRRVSSGIKFRAP